MSQSKRVNNPTKIIQARYVQNANVSRVAESGQIWTIIGATNTAKKVGAYRTVRIYNADTNPHFVAFGASGMDAPTGATNGIVVLAGDVFILNSGSGEYVRSDSSSVYAYTAEDDLQR